MPLSGCSLPGCRLPLAAVVRGTCSMLVNNVLLMCSPQSHVECPEEMRQDLMSLPCVQLYGSSWVCSEKMKDDGLVQSMTI